MISYLNDQDIDGSKMKLDKELEDVEMVNMPGNGVKGGYDDFGGQESEFNENLEVVKK